MMTLRKVMPAIILAATMIIGHGSANAQAKINKDFEPFLTRGETTWAVKSGVRVNTFDWNIASDITGNATPNILSELTWNDITLFEIEGEVRHEEPLDLSFVKGGLHLEAAINVGLPISGENQDSDYNGDNRTLEFSRSLADSDSGYSVGGTLAAGYKFYLTGDPKRRARNILKTRTPQTTAGRARRAAAYRKAISRVTPVITLTPLAGYGIDQQKYGMEGVTSVIPGGGVPIGANNFDWNYQANWYGPFLGLETAIKGKKNMVRLRGEYHMLDYYGEGFWRGRIGFRQDPSFTQEVEADGIKARAEYAYALEDDVALTFDAHYEIREGEDGIDKLNFANNTTAFTKLNEVNDQSYGAMLGLRYNW